ncbi:hypothetical protein B0H16DRAFT_1831639 [Mycena metata]|uniref:Uncharacterized protein n=1 Tax=Mycena metata TaxID=1033252 RepID=A0AAD7J5E7_9AGAR|nr:hypothetical protein B0H16DRAFT_1831639 [Mycena metata]
MHQKLSGLWGKKREDLTGTEQHLGSNKDLGIQFWWGWGVGWWVRKIVFNHGICAEAARRTQRQMDGRKMREFPVNVVAATDDNKRICGNTKDKDKDKNRLEDSRRLLFVRASNLSAVVAFATTNPSLVAFWSWSSYSQLPTAIRQQVTTPNNLTTPWPAPAPPARPSRSASAPASASSTSLPIGSTTSFTGYPQTGSTATDPGVTALPGNHGTSSGDAGTGSGNNSSGGGRRREWHSE